MPDWYSRVPKDLVENVRFRQYLFEECRRSSRKQKAVYEGCKEDVLFYFNVCLFTYDPRRPSGEKAIPFITYPFQDEAILSLLAAIREDDWLLLQKSRDMGASWMMCGVFDHQCLFEEHCKFLMMSRNFDLVDKRGDSDSLFWKIDFIHKHLPLFILDEEKDIIRRKGGIEYIKTNSAVTGATTTEAAGIGGRATGVAIDEFSRFDPKEADSIMSGMPDVSNCLIYNFTPNPDMGKAHPSYELVRRAEKGVIKQVRMHWRAHPEKAKGLYRVDQKTHAKEILDTTYPFPANYPWQLDGRFEWHSPWFDKERARRGNDQHVAEMLEIDYDSSGFNVFDAQMIRDYIGVYCKPPILEGNIFYNEDTAKPSHFAVAPGGPIKLWTQIDGYGNAPQVQYYAGADISLGVRTTASCFSVCRGDTGEKILELAISDKPPREFATMCIAICKWLTSNHGDVLFAWEQKGPGDTFGVRVIELGYYRIYYHTHEVIVGATPTRSPGWNPCYKGNLLEQYRSALSTSRYINRSKLAMEETMEFVNTVKGPEHRANQNRKNDPSGASINHGDRCIADALSCKMLVENTQSQEAIERSPQPGTLQFLFDQEERELTRRDELYPNWNGKKRFTF